MSQLPKYDLYDLFGDGEYETFNTPAENPGIKVGAILPDAEYVFAANPEETEISAQANYVVGEETKTVNADVAYYENATQSDGVWTVSGDALTDAPVNAGTYYVMFTAAADGYGELTKAVKYEIKKKPLTLTIFGGTTPVFYDGKSHDLLNAETPFETSNFATGEDTGVIAAIQQYVEYDVVFTAPDATSENLDNAKGIKIGSYKITDLGYGITTDAEDNVTGINGTAKINDGAMSGWNVYVCLVANDNNGAITWNPYNAKLAGTVLKSNDVVTNNVTKDGKADVNGSRTIDLADAVAVVTTRTNKMTEKQRTVYMATIIRADADRNGKVEIVSTEGAVIGDAAFVKYVVAPELKPATT